MPFASPPPGAFRQFPLRDPFPQWDYFSQLGTNLFVHEPCGLVSDVISTLDLLSGNRAAVDPMK